MTGTIHEVQKEFAIEKDFVDWLQLVEYYMHWDNMKLLIAIDEVMERYASQFQTNTDLVTTEICVLRERVAELEEHMKECASVLSWVLDNARPDSDWQTFTNSVMNAMVEAESLINKGK